jgi:hypothetical protein
MDIFSHGIAGAATGTAFGKPLTGAALAMLPDIMLLGKRRPAPTQLYNVTHSLLFIIITSLIGQLWDYGAFVFWVLISHIILDLPTHGKQWGPCLLYPLQKRFSFGQEWEFFNRSWLTGMLLTIIWSCIWVLI